ncbi:MAG: hypothetical protein EXR68_02725 [Dehalococcoidia bacterium]|nr:hypothetical protein [Dehalococcoidia bacterium]
MSAVRTAGLGQRQAREVRWYVLLPLAVALAAAYNDFDLALAAHAHIAQGLLRMQELWCTRGG